MVSPRVERTIVAADEGVVDDKEDGAADVARRRKIGRQPMKSIAIYYARVSSEQQALQATIESQVVALKERVAADGHVILPQDIYLDDGFSGSTLVRPALEATA